MVLCPKISLKSRISIPTNRALQTFFFQTADSENCQPHDSIMPYTVYRGPMKLSFLKKNFTQDTMQYTTKRKVADAKREIGLVNLLTGERGEAQIRKEKQLGFQRQSCTKKNNSFQNAEERQTFAKLKKYVVTHFLNLM